MNTVPLNGSTCRAWFFSPIWSSEATNVHAGKRRAGGKRHRDVSSESCSGGRAGGGIPVEGTILRTGLGPPECHECAIQTETALALSFSRALQSRALKILAGQEATVAEAQQALYHRVMCNRAARRGTYEALMETDW